MAFRTTGIDTLLSRRLRTRLQLVTLCVWGVSPSAAWALQPLRYELPNGLEVILQPDATVAHVAVAVTYHVGLRDEPTGYHGLAHLVEHMTYRGSRHLPGSLMAPLLEAGVEDSNGFVSADETTYYAVVPAQQLPIALWVESERMAFSLERFDPRALELERGIVIRERELHAGRDSRLPQFVAETLYPEGHPYRQIHRAANSEESLELDHSRWFFQTWYYPKNATLTLTGGFELERAKTLIEQYFGAIANPPVCTQRAPVDAIAFDGQETIHLATPAQRDRLQMIWTVPCPDQACPAELALEMAAVLLTGDRQALLTRELVQVHSVAAHASMVVFRREHHLEITLSVGLAIHAAHERAIQVVDAVLTQLQRRAVSSRDLRVARLRLMTEDALRLEQPLGKLFNAQRMSQRAGGFESPEQRAERLRALSPADVQRALQQYLPLDRRLIVASHADKDARPGAELQTRTGALRARTVRP